MLNFYARVSGEVESDSGNSTLIYFLRSFKKIRIKCYLYYLNEKIAHTKIKNPRTHMIFFSSILDLKLLRFRFALRLPFLELKPPVIWLILLQSLICGTNCTRCFFCPIDNIALPKHSEQLLGTYGNLLNLKKHEIFDLKKTSYRRRKKERRKKNKAVFRFASND